MGSLPPVFLFFPPFHLLVLFSFQQTSKALYPLPSSFSFPLPPPLNFLILFVSLTFAFLFPSFYQLFYLSIDNFSYTLFFPFHVFLISFTYIFYTLCFIHSYLFPFFCFSSSDFLCKFLPFQTRFPVPFFIAFLSFLFAIFFFTIITLLTPSLPISVFLCRLLLFLCFSLPLFLPFFSLVSPPQFISVFYFTLCSILL